MPGSTDNSNGLKKLSGTGKINMRSPWIPAFAGIEHLSYFTDI